ncbi:DUF1294 domain-containing protein [Desulfuromonas acetoxidans]|nr:cold shock and DUF1294 domain-containing protein [Desulfuromonas acetoxidans]MBF0646788.1 cold shock and DUF1294 domain-containing protein [Desulfuromonas acetoxidans]NVD24634.1 DUF1294 domain-containing protein [Desulfuromonas acetoxidans]NVE17997.1 DUF1294 domain-containing protein [Desulfuromonas acetoxidans]
MRKRGTITSWNKDKGYGFILPNSGSKQIFVHIKDFSNRHRQPEVEQLVNYSESVDRQGRPCAINATRVGDGTEKIGSKKAAKLPITIAILFLGVVAASVFVGDLPIYIFIAYIALSIITYFTYAFDKSAAQKGAWRTQESTLHLFSMAGGWPGALIAQQILRHKNQKESFRFVFWVTSALNLFVLIWLFSANGSKFLKSLLQNISLG